MQQPSECVRSMMVVRPGSTWSEASEPFSSAIRTALPSWRLLGCVGAVIPDEHDRVAGLVVHTCPPFDNLHDTEVLSDEVLRASTASTDHGPAPATKRNRSPISMA